MNMKKTMFMVALAAMSLASCSNDEILEIQQDEISFSTISDRASRATTTDNIQNFEVWGVLHQDNADVMYFEKLPLTRTTTGSWVNVESGYFWPEGKMDFYAISPKSCVDATASVSASAYASNTNTIVFETQTQQAQQVDLLYALTTDEEKQVEDVPLNFRHALSQITYRVKVNVPTADSSMQKLKVTVNSVTLNNVNSKSTLSFPKAATNATGNGYGSWGDKSVVADYTVTPAAAVVCDANTAATNGKTDALANISDKALDADGKDTGDEVAPLYLIPQEVAKATFTDGEAINSSTTGCYFTLDCKIEAYAQNGTTLVTLHDGNAHVAADINWLQGYKYVYTFVFGGENGGGTDDDGDDTIVPIKFSVTVDDFQTGTVSPVPLPMN